MSCILLYCLGYLITKYDYKSIFGFINVKMIYKTMVSALKIGFATLGTILLYIVKEHILKKGIPIDKREII